VPPFEVLARTAAQCAGPEATNVDCAQPKRIILCVVFHIDGVSSDLCTFDHVPNIKLFI